MKSRRKVLRPSGLIEKRRKNIKRKIIIGSSVFLFVFISLIFLSHIDYLKITNISIKGNKIVDHDEIKNYIENNLTGNHLFLFSKRNIFLYPREEIKALILNNFPIVEGINIEEIDSNSILVNLEERGVKYLWCQNKNIESINPEERESCFFVDDAGFVFSSAPYYSGDVYFKFYNEKEDLDGISIGRSVLSKDEFKRMIDFKEGLKSIGVKSYGLIIKESSYEFLIGNSGLGNKPKIIFKKDNDLEKIKNNLAAALKVEPFATKFKNNFDSLLYIDLRFGNKVYYKFK